MARGLTTFGILIFVAFATLPAAAGASVYIFETWWAYMLPPCYYVQRLGEGDPSGLLVHLKYWDEQKFDRDIYVYKFDGQGSKIREWLVDELLSWVQLYTVSGLIPFQDDIIISYQVTHPGNPVTDYSVLRRCGFSSWVVGNADPYSQIWYFRDLSRPPAGSYYYCYRWYNGALRVCKSPGTPEVTSYFTPGENDVHHMAADDGGVVFCSYSKTIRKYNESGSVITSWENPSTIWDLNVDSQGRVLVLSGDRYTYVYSSTGSFLESFTYSYPFDVQSAAIGPGGKYYVLATNSSRTVILMYCFTPDPTNIQPTSVGKIKALFH